MADESEPGDEPPSEEPIYDQAFFLDLAAKGKDAWNAWRRNPANKDVYVTFKGIDFSEVPKDRIDFTEFEFGPCAEFSQCKWRGVDLFRAGATDIFKPGRACFPGASFGDRANFEGAAFDAAAQFDTAVFDGGVSFQGAAFGEGASFQEATIGSVSSFDGAAFGDWAFFDSAIFEGAVTFRGKPTAQWTSSFVQSRMVWARMLERCSKRCIRSRGNSMALRRIAC